MNHLRDLDFWLRAGPTLAAVIVPFLTYLWLGRKIEQYKTVLSKELETHNSQLQYESQLKFYEFQTRYSWLHKSRAEAIEKLSALLARVEGDVNVWITSSHELRNQTEDEHSNVQWSKDRVPELASWLKQYATALKEQNIVPLMALLEDKFRRLLQAEVPNYQPYRMGSPGGGPDIKQLLEPGFWRRIGRLLGR